MRTRIAKLPPNLQDVNLDVLDYIDEWAHARTVHTKTTSKIYFVSQNDKTLGFPKDNNEMSVRAHITLILPVDYAKAHEEIFKKGIKATAKQLADDGFFEESLKVIPTTFYVFDNDFTTNFTMHFQMSLRNFKLPKEIQQKYEKLRANTINNQRRYWQYYKNCKAKYIEWNEKHHPEKAPV